MVAKPKKRTFEHIIMWTPTNSLGSFYAILIELQFHLSSSSIIIYILIKKIHLPEGIINGFRVLLPFLQM